MAIAPSKPGLTNSGTAEAAIGKHLFVKYGAADNGLLPGAAASDALIGISTDINAETGEPCDYYMSDIALLYYGGNVTRGAFLTSDANAKGVAASPGNRVGAIALESGVEDDLRPVMIVHGVM
jgi:hypothetical protein